jgi:hypothetical protein
MPDKTKMATNHKFSIAKSILCKSIKTWDLERKSLKNSVAEFFF